ncbi:MAG: hypothetical protein QOE61_2499 [Micromonosporaceae bacterium]|nr:hypothetical protein [Micromonosporaceae bacterium]
MSKLSVCLVSPGLTVLPLRNTVRLEPHCATRREATYAPTQSAPLAIRLRGRFAYAVEVAAKAWRSGVKCPRRTHSVG